MSNDTDLQTRPSPALLSFVIPVFNEAESLPFLMARLATVSANVPCAVEWVFVNDGSHDASERLLISAAARDERVKVLCLARNFGHQAAVTAGLDHAQGDAIVIMDADLQDPPELVHTMLERYRAGYHVVYAQRSQRQGESLFKRLSASMFYWFMGRFVFKGLPRDSGDFRLLSSEAAAALSSLREGQRFIRGMVSWVGFPQTGVSFERQPRVAGTSKYPLRKMIRFAWDAILSFSSAPLRVASYFGLLVICGGIAMGCYAVIRDLLYHDLEPGWPSLMVVQCTIGGALLLSCGMIGEYCARIYEELKFRPLYIVRRSANISSTVAPTRAVVSQPREHRIKSAS